MSSVGGIPFFTVDTPSELAGWVGEPFTRPGVAGVGMQIVGWSGKAFQCRVQGACANDNYRNAAILACNALKTALVTLVDDFGVSWYYLRVQDFRPVRKFDTIGNNQGGILYDQWFEGEFTLIPSATYY
jgi:hypothetical protein